MNTKTIQEIEELLFKSDRTLSRKEQKQIQTDSRIGVKKLWNRYCILQEKYEKLQQDYLAKQEFEKALREKGKTLIAGLDEAGRGPLAGPVVAAAVILREEVQLLGVNDSKQLSEAKREEFYEKIKESALHIGIGIVEPEEIDRINIYEASKLAMIKAIEGLNCRPDHLLIDALKLPVAIEQTSLIKGDARSITIAAASIVAKVTRDRLMDKYSHKFPEYGFHSNKGYGTKEHLLALEKHGSTQIHRKSFSPVSNQLNETNERDDILVNNSLI